MSQYDLKIGPKIKAFRRQMGLQANKLSSQLGISPSYLALIEGGKRRIDGDLLLKICQELKIQLSDLTSKIDLNLSNKGKSNDVDGSWGDYTIQEGESDLFLINNRSGKKFKFNLTEVL